MKPYLLVGNTQLKSCPESLNRGVCPMPGKCDLCGKTPQYGHNVSHSKRRTNRRWMLNAQKRTLFLQGRRVRLNVCSRCLRTLYKTQ